MMRSTVKDRDRCVGKAGKFRSPGAMRSRYNGAVDPLASVVHAVPIQATDGALLAGRAYEPREGAPVRCTVLMLPGIGVPQRVFRHIGAWFAERGVRALSVDYRGMGESAGDSAAVRTASLSTWAQRDAVGALRFAEQRWPSSRIVLFGHSFGGQALGFADDFARVSAAVLVGSQFGQARHWDGFGRVKVAAYWNLILPAAAAFFDVVPGWTGLGEPLPCGVAREWALWGRSADWLIQHVHGADQRYATFSRPLRAYAITDDDIAPSRAVEDLLRRFRATKPERVDLGPSDLGLRRIGHVGLFRPGPTERVWDEILAYIQRQSAAAP